MVSTDQGITATWVRAESNITPASPLHITTNGGTFANAHGWYGGFVSDKSTTEQITDRGIIGLFIRKENKITPANPLNNTINGGTFANQHGWYGALSSFNGDALSDHGNTQVMFPDFGDLSFPKHFLMQAYESGGGCVGHVQRIWIAVGFFPDVTAQQYTGTRCSPPGTFSNFAVLTTW